MGAKNYTCNNTYVYEILFAIDVEKDLKKFRAFERKAILDAIEKSLAYEPTKPAKNRKVLVNFTPPWDAEPPVWELRVGEYRVFYDVDDEAIQVQVRAVRHKPLGKTTEDIA